MKFPALEWISIDGKLIFAARIIRTFAYGFLSIILAIYLKLNGFDDILIGIILSFTLINSIIFTLIASFYADRIGRKKILIIYGVLMSISGIIFLVTTNPVALIIAALIGTINVTGTETGAFLSIEQAILPQTIKDLKKKTTLFALYNMAGTFAMSLGILVSGLPKVLEINYGLKDVDSIKPLFVFYALIGLITVFIYYRLSKNVEVTGKYSIDKSIPKPLTKTLSPDSKIIVGKLSALFALDSLGGGFVIQSLVSLWFFTKFGVDLTTLSYILSIAGILSAFSFIIAAKIADKIGLVNTMVFSHIPSNILIILVAFAPSLPIAIILYLARMTLSQMDIPTRQAYIVSVVKENERTAAAGITNISRNISQAISPSIAGFFLQSAVYLSAPFVICGALKIVYDIVLYFNFRKVKPFD